MEATAKSTTAQPKPGEKSLSRDEYFVVSKLKFWRVLTSKSFLRNFPAPSRMDKSTECYSSYGLFSTSKSAQWSSQQRAWHHHHSHSTNEQLAKYSWKSIFRSGEDRRDYQTRGWLRVRDQPVVQAFFSGSHRHSNPIHRKNSLLRRHYGSVRREHVSSKAQVQRWPQAIDDSISEAWILTLTTLKIWNSWKTTTLSCWT